MLNPSRGGTPLPLLLTALLGACSERASDVHDRTLAQCAERACECVFTSECPGPLACVDGACATAVVIPDVSPDVATDVADGSETAAGDSGPDSVDSANDAVPDGDGPRPFGAYCVGNTDCLSGYCLEAAVGGYCTHQCVDGCPEDWVCKSVATATDPVSVCAQDTNRLCLPCEADRACGGDLRDLCLDVGGGRFCGRDCGSDACPSGYSCESVSGPDGLVKQCVPTNGTCDCTPESAGLQKTCTSENAAGTCVGIATCDPDVGFVGCTARVPNDETCNGRDDDCDGTTDEAQDASACSRTNAVGTCSGSETCQGALGRVCSAPEPAVESCNDRDDDCDGQTDEDFRLGGSAPQTVEHCGSCNIDCNERFAHAAAVACGNSGTTPVCALVACEPGYIIIGGSCLNENATLCTPCANDGDCFGEESSCLALSDTDPRTFCARDCSGDGETTTSCPTGYDCTTTATGEQCLPATASCDCTASNAGQEKACTRNNALGTCYGLETCDAERGWVDCQAPEPVPETCDGRDNDCDGEVDEGLVLGDACETSNAAGSCSGVTFCAGALGERCSAPTPAAETCNGQDDDCDGTTDEGFGRDLGVAVSYDLSVEHCGACNYACPAVVHGTPRCDGSGPSPRCVAADCDEGYYPLPGAATCLAVPRKNQCAACVTNADCQGPGDRCIDDGGARYCARDCGAGAIYDTTASACTGVAGQRGCCPVDNVCTAVGAERLCRPRSGTCACTVEGATVACEVASDLGTCFGVRTCSIANGLSACSAATPSAELCNDRDDDCDGRVDAADDSLLLTSTPNGTSLCGPGPGCVGAWRCVQGDWDCSAREAQAEVCDTVDNDCDGATDEDFRDGAGRYTTVQHCGGCGVACAALVVNATATECVLVLGSPTCRATACAAGTYAFDGGRACLALPDNLCEACQDDGDCLVPGSRCLGTGADRYCGRSCAAGSPYGVSCPLGYVCGGGNDAQCMPVSGSCQCGPGDEGVTRACAVGACTGLQTCEESGGGFAFDTCSAEGLIPEVCDGVDNDCDNTIDEGFRNGSGTYTAANACGSCGNDCTKRWRQDQHVNGTCSGGTTPTCIIGSCGTDVVNGTSYQFVDTNGLPGDGCECRKVSGTTQDEPDLDFGATRPAADAVYSDADCDGIDGRVGDALFVRAGASAPGAGTLASPYPTIMQAISGFGASGKLYVLVAGGEYRESVVLSANIKLHGGYAPDFQRRNIVTFETRILGVEPVFGNGTPLPGTVYAAGLRSGKTIVSGVTIIGYDVTTLPAVGQVGYTSHALYIIDSDQTLELRNNLIVGGLGGSGGDGLSGNNGYGRAGVGGTQLDGGAGVSVEAGGASCTGTTCNGGSRAGGTAGANPQCGEASGIAGGPALCPVYNQASWLPPIAGKDGAPGYHWTRDALGSVDTCSVHLTEAGYPIDIKKLDGLDGAPGGAGAEGLQGLGCSNGEGTVVAGVWSNAAGADGVLGVAGPRGGAGAPSGGVDTAAAGQMPAGVGPNGTYRHKLGAGGGGAGAGGCGGAGGRGAGSGGASMAVFVGWVAVTTTSAPLFRANVVARRFGGDGGTGGYGGAGGVGGNGGAGGVSADFWIGFRAGNGGRGGNGGEGGGGGGGCGGASFGFGVFGKPAGFSVDYTTSNAFTLLDGTTTGGQGGEGGPSGTARAGARGGDGLSSNQLIR